MSFSASQANKFYKEVAKNRRLWTICDSEGFPAPLTAGGKRAQPFWSSISRVQKIITSIPAYRGFDPVELSWNEFLESWVPDLTSSSILIGVNWSGRRAIGYSLEPEVVVRFVEAAQADS